MLINFLFGLLVPWVIGIYVIKQDVFLVLIVSMISSLLAFLINDIGFYMGWWYVSPKGYGTLSFIPYNFG